ncbi:MAG: hypothetical protein GY696_40420, partial [Gammaproteobacteria bacterium]|nr:hypothetical protein [Gammaproteobacteria bacterium]
MFSFKNRNPEADRLDLAVWIMARFIANQRDWRSNNQDRMGDGPVHRTPRGEPFMATATLTNIEVLSPEHTDWLLNPGDGTAKIHRNPARDSAEAEEEDDCVSEIHPMRIVGWNYGTARTMALINYIKFQAARQMGRWSVSSLMAIMTPPGHVISRIDAVANHYLADPKRQDGREPRSSRNEDLYETYQPAFQSYAQVLDTTAWVNLQALCVVWALDPDKFLNSAGRDPDRSKFARSLVRCRAEDTMPIMLGFDKVYTIGVDWNEPLAESPVAGTMTVADTVQYSIALRLMYGGTGYVLRGLYTWGQRSGTKKLGQLGMCWVGAAVRAVNYYFPDCVMDYVTPRLFQVEFPGMN